MICSSAFWKQKCENLKNVSLAFFKFQSRGITRQFYCTGIIIYNKTRELFFVSIDRQTFLGLEMTSNSRGTSPLSTLECVSDTMFALVSRSMFLAHWLLPYPFKSCRVLGK